MKSNLKVLLAAVCFILSLAGQIFAQAQRSHAMVLVRPVTDRSQSSQSVKTTNLAVTNTANAAAANTTATVSFQGLFRFPAEQPNVQNLLTNNFYAGLIPITPDSNGQYNAYFRDYFVAAEVIINNAQDGDIFGSTLTFTPPAGGQLNFPPITFYASYQGYSDCFVGETAICGDTSAEIFWVGSAQCNDGPGFNFQFTVDGSQVGTSPSFYVHPRIEEGSVPTPNTPVAPKYNQGTYPLPKYPYDSICRTSINTRDHFHCDATLHPIETPWAISAKGCALTDSAMLLTYEGYSSTPSFSITPDQLNLDFESDGGYNTDGGLTWALSKVAQTFQSSLNMFSSGNCPEGGCNDPGLYQNVCSFGPQIIAINHTGSKYASGPRTGQYEIEHWVTVTGQTDDKKTWVIQDPAGGIQDTTLALQGYFPANTYLAYRTFAGPGYSAPANAIGIYLFSPAELLLTDPLGHRLGLDPNNDNLSYTEIENSGYTAYFLTDEDPADAGLGPDQAPEIKELNVVQPVQGEYTLTVTGTGTGTYSMPVYLTDQNSVTDMTQLNTIPTYQGAVHKYSFNYTSPFPSSISGPAGLSGALTGESSNTDANLFLTFANPITTGSLVPAGRNNYPLIIFYGPTTVPSSFTASLNGRNVTSLFSPVPGASQVVNLPLPNGTSSLALQIKGATSDGQTATDSDTLLFDVGGSAPNAPMDLTATPYSSTQINLAWRASTSPDVTYSVFRSTAAGFTPSSANQVASGLSARSYSDTGLTASTTYYYVVESVDPYASSPASNQATVTTYQIGYCPTQASTIVANFNDIAISSGDYVWFDSTLKASGLGKNPVTVFVRNSTLTFTVNGTSYSVPVPDANIIFSPTATTATTTFNSNTNQWDTTVPSTGLTGSVLLDPAEYLAADGLPGGIKNVTWTAGFATDTSGVNLQWEWSAAVYKAFSSDYNALGVKPVDGNKASEYQNSDLAGTPENYKTYVTSGATGNGGTDYTGNDNKTGGDSCGGNHSGSSGTVSVTPAVVNGCQSNGGGTTTTS